MKKRWVWLGTVEDALYRVMNAWKQFVNTCVGTYIGSTILNTATEKTHDSVGDFLLLLLPPNGFSVNFMWICAAFWLVAAVLYWFLRLEEKKKTPAERLHDIMKEESSEVLELVSGAGYMWGKDRTILCAENILDGWDPEQIVINDVEGENYVMDEAERAAFDIFCKEDQQKMTIARGNNLDRWMVTGIFTNFNRTDKRIYIDLRRTDWLHTSFSWRCFKEASLTEQKKMIKSLIAKEAFRPNSFCLHLIITTKDKKIVVTGISNNKSNDYPTTWAVSLGEQIEGIDFQSGAILHKNFVRRWVERALEEEFGLNKSQCERLIGLNGIRVLALTCEADIYNVAMVTVVNVNATFDAFLHEINRNPEIDKEYEDIIGIDISDIPQVLRHCSSDELHPSSQLRMFLAYIHRRGMDKFLVEYDQEDVNKKKFIRSWSKEHKSE